MQYKEIKFDEKLHEYTNEKNTKYISVTTLIGKYAEEFDTDYWSMYTALKDRHYKVKAEYEKGVIIVAGVAYKLKDLKKDKTFATYQNLTIATWAANTADACMKGSATHNFLEDNINKSKGDYKGSTNASIQPVLGLGHNVIATTHDLDVTEIGSKFPYIYNRLKSYIERGCSIYAEKKVHLDDFKLAGMIDVPIFKGNKFCILDWKTNKDEFLTVAGYYKKENIGGKWIKGDKFIATGKTMLYPLHHVPCCNFYKYAMQLSTYAYILECWGYELVEGGLEIIHIRDNHEPKVIKIPYLKKEVEAMLQDYLQAS